MTKDDTDIKIEVRFKTNLILYLWFLIIFILILFTAFIDNIIINKNISDFLKSCLILSPFVIMGILHFISTLILDYKEFYLLNDKIIFINYFGIKKIFNLIELREIFKGFNSTYQFKFNEKIIMIPIYNNKDYKKFFSAIDQLELKKKEIAQENYKPTIRKGMRQISN